MVRTPTPVRRSVSAAALVALVAAALGLAACGGGETADLANGQKQFVSACGGCHTLADAGTTGTVGPDLDDAFRGARRDGFEQSSFEELVAYWIEKPEQISEPIMPPNLVTGQDAADVAAYVAAVAGTNEESPARPAEATE